MPLRALHPTNHGHAHHGRADDPPVVGASSVTPPSASPSTAPSTTSSSPIAFTGAELALMFTIGAIAIGVGGMLVLVSRRRRSEQAYGGGRR